MHRFPRVLFSTSEVSLLRLQHLTVIVRSFEYAVSASQGADHADKQRFYNSRTHAAVHQLFQQREQSHF